MESLGQYIQSDALEAILDEFCRASHVSVVVFDSDGSTLARATSDPGNFGNSDGVDADVCIGGEICGRILIKPIGPDALVEQAARGFADLLGDVLSRLAGTQRELRKRIDQLATLYRVTAEFTGRRDLQSVMDLVTETVVTTMNARASTIRLLNKERTELLVASEARLSPEYLDKGPILVGESLIDSAVLDNLAAVQIKNMHDDPRILYPEEARREGLVSAFCVPMIYKGRAEGVLRVYMGSEHEFDWFERSLANTIASEAAAAIVNARLYQESIRGARMQRELQLAATVQRRMIPSKAPDVPELDIGMAYVPCFELAGDFFDFIPLGEGNLGIVVCDVVGKGVRASLLMASIRASLRAHASYVYELSDVIGRVNRDLCTETGSSDFATLFYGVFNPASGLFTYANAGHMPALLVQDGVCSELDTSGGIIGLDEESTWSHRSVQIDRGDTLMFYSDGLSDAMNFEDESFGRKRIVSGLLDALDEHEDADTITAHILWEMRRFAGLQKRFDDLTIVTVKRR
ncbi:MAG: PP2C family protein-serine/threonine phosphatase [Phycisphaerales bacterium]|nr:PP2C family protein-serine/threonine phosphatase [Phycisphaerales bacterium]